MMPKYVFLNDVIVNNLHKQRKNGKFCDIRIIIGKKHIWVHSAVLCSISAFIKHEFFNSPTHSKRKHNKNPCHSSIKIKLNGKVDVDCFDCLVKLLDFIYGREIVFENDHMSHVYDFCKVLNLSDIIVSVIHDNESRLKDVKSESNFDVLNHVEQPTLDPKRDSPLGDHPFDFPLGSDETPLGNNLSDKFSLYHYKHPPNKFPSGDCGKQPNLVKESSNVISVDEKYPSFGYENPLEDLPFNDGTKTNDIHQSVEDTNTDCDSFTYDAEEYEEPLKMPFKKPHNSNIQVNLPTGKTQNCIGCNFKSNKSMDLLEHLRQTGHGGNVCSLCWTELDNAEDLKKHFILHENPKPFFCGYCDLRFQTRSLLGQHLPRHMFAKPYACPHCQKAFKRKHGLNCHLITHSPEKKHLCDQCGFSTTHARILRAHKLIHSGNLFKCTFSGCAHTSTRKENMKQHFSTHSNEKPFICELCGLKFTQGKSLKRHSLIHSKGELNNICPHCPFKARRIDNLKAHILRQHSDKRYKRDFSESITVEPDVKDIINPVDNLFKKRRKKFP